MGNELHQSLDLAMVAWAAKVSQEDAWLPNPKRFSNTRIQELLEFLWARPKMRRLFSDVSELVIRLPLNRDRHTIMELAVCSYMEAFGDPGGEQAQAASGAPDDD
jgi:hypothetical protein